MTCCRSETAEIHVCRRVLVLFVRPRGSGWRRTGSGGVRQARPGLIAACRVSQTMRNGAKWDGFVWSASHLNGGSREMRGAMQVWAVVTVVVVVGDGRREGRCVITVPRPPLLGCLEYFWRDEGSFAFLFPLPPSASPSPPQTRLFNNPSSSRRGKASIPLRVTNPLIAHPPHLPPPPRCPESVSSALLPRATWRLCPTPRFGLLTASCSPSSAPRPR